MIRWSRILLVGELNPYGADPRLALFHLPRGASGDRLRVIMGLRDVSYSKLSKVNLCLGRWSMRAARHRAAEILTARDHDVIVLLGAKVRAAFAGPAPFDDCFSDFGKPGQKHMVSLPHPSGRCLEWNAIDSVQRARDALRDAAPDVPWGEV